MTSGMGLREVIFGVVGVRVHFSGDCDLCCDFSL